MVTTLFFDSPFVRNLQPHRLRWSLLFVFFIIYTIFSFSNNSFSLLFSLILLSRFKLFSRRSRYPARATLYFLVLSLLLWKQKSMHHCQNLIHWPPLLLLFPPTLWIPLGFIALSPYEAVKTFIRILHLTLETLF